MSDTKMELRFVLGANCNFACYFCLNEYVTNKGKERFFTAEDYSYISDIAYTKFNISKITLTGGEPLLRNDCGEIARLLKRDYNHITLVTNGLLLNRRLSALDYIDELHVSFHSFHDEDWKRITGRQGTRRTVQENIILVRSMFENLTIKLNVVAECGNNTSEDIQMYLEFAREYNLEISVFKEGFFKIARLLGMNNDIAHLPQASSWWDLTNFAPRLMQIEERKQVFDVKGVRVSLCTTESDERTWNGIWISPIGVMYSNVLHTSPDLQISELVRLRDTKATNECLESVFVEADLNRQLKIGLHDEDILHKKLGKLLDERSKKMPTTSMVQK